MPSRNSSIIPSCLLLLAVSSGLPLAARADDAWLVADPFTVDAGQSVWLGFVGGSVFPLGEALVAPEDVDSMEDFSDAQGRSLFDAGSPPDAAGRRETLSTAGIHVFAGRLLPQVIEMGGTQFDDYLSEERAAGAILERLHDDPDMPVVEEYTRYAKAIVEVTPAPQDDAGYGLVVGHRLEIVPMSNPCRDRIGDTAEFVVLLDGYPWPGIPISAYCEGFESGAFVEETVTNDKGRAEIPIDNAGRWLVRAHFIRRTADLRRAEWESFWATLTFCVASEAAEQPESEPASDKNGDATTERRDVPYESMSRSLIPPIPFPLEELCSFLSPHLRMIDKKAA